MQPAEQMTVTRKFSGNDYRNYLLQNSVLYHSQKPSCLLNIVFTRTWLERQIGIYVKKY